MQSRSIGIGLVGHGFMGRAHAHAYLVIPHIFWPSTPRPELVAVAGRSPARVRETAARFGFRSWTTDWRELVEDASVEVVDNVATSDAHVEPTLAAIRAGKHVICEKPLALSAAAAERLQAATAAAGVKHLVCFNYRFFPAVRLARDLVRSGELGELHQVRFRYAQDWRLGPPATMQSAAGALPLIASHAIDQARFLAGEIERVAAIMAAHAGDPSPVVRGQPLDPIDTVTAVVELAGGVTGTIDASLVAAGRKNLLAWELNGSRGSVAWSLEHLNVLCVAHSRAGFREVLACEPEHPLMRPWWPSGHLLGWEHGHINMLAHFLDAVARGRPVGPDGATFADGLQAARVADAIVEAQRSGEWVRVTR